MEPFAAPPHAQSTTQWQQQPHPPGGGDRGNSSATVQRVNEAVAVKMIAGAFSSVTEEEHEVTCREEEVNEAAIRFAGKPALEARLALLLPSASSVSRST